MTEKIKKYLAQFFWDLPEKYQNTFKRKKDINNLKRMKFFLIIFSILLFTIFIFQILKNPFTLSFYFQIAVITISLFLIYIYFKRTPEEIKELKTNQKILFYMTLFFILTWSAVRTGYLHFDEISLFIYIITTFFISAIFYLKWKLYLLLFGIMATLILISNYIFGLVYIDIFSRVLLLLNSYVFGFIISRVSYITFMENFLKLKEIEEKYKSIIEKNERLKDILSNKKEDNNELRSQLKEVKQKFTFALEKAETGLWEWNIKDDKIVYNKEWAKILDYHLNKLDGRLETWRDLIHIEDRDKFAEIVNKIKAGKKKKFEFEHRLKTGGGKWKWMLASGEVYKENEKGEPLKVVGIHKSINLSKTLEKNLEKDEEEFKKILNRLPFAVLLYKNGEWQFVNKTAEKLLGYSAQELLGSSNWDFIDSNYLKWIKKEKDKSRKKFLDLKIIDKNGKEKLVDFYAGKVNVNGEKIIILAAKEK